MDWIVDNKLIVLPTILVGLAGIYLFKKQLAIDRKVQQNKNVVITGSSKGIGFGLAKKFLQLGNNVQLFLILYFWDRNKQNIIFQL